MTWLWITLWAAAVAIACGLAFIFIVARAFGRRHGARESVLPALILSPGLRLCRGHPAAIFALSWLTWFALGLLVILLARTAR